MASDRKKGDGFWGGIGGSDQRDPYTGHFPMPHDDLGRRGSGPRGYDPQAVHAQNQERIFADIMKEAEAARKGGRWQEAVTAYSRALNMEAGRDSAAARAGRGECYRMLSRFKEALSDFDEVLQQEPSSLFALRGKTGVLESLGRFDEALVYCDMVLRREPSDAWTLKHKASITQAIQQGAIGTGCSRSGCGRRRS